MLVHIIPYVIRYALALFTAFAPLFWLWVFWFNHLVLSNSIAYSCATMHRYSGSQFSSLNDWNVKVLAITECTWAMYLATTSAAAADVVVLAHTPLIKILRPEVRREICCWVVKMWKNAVFEQKKEPTVKSKTAAQKIGQCSFSNSLKSAVYV